ncbi:TPA: hypothetical protein DCX15_03995 [bacterium]|nr:hypothetical protein [bacterium]
MAISQDASVRETARILADNDASGGTITSEEGEDDLDKIKVKEIMSVPAITVNREEDLKKACKLMYKNNIHRLITHQTVKRGRVTHG